MISFGKQFPRYAAFKREVESLPEIGRTATSQYELYKGYNMSPSTPRGGTEPIMLSLLEVDSSFVSVLGVQWKAGSPFMNSSRNVVLNETAVAQLGLGDHPLGQTFKIYNEDQVVSGVVRDFNFESLRTKMGPLGLQVLPASDSFWGVAAKGRLLANIEPHVNLPQLIGKLKDIYARYDPKTPFEYHFLDDVFDDLYRSEARLETIFRLFTGVAILIACLGVFALATFSAEQRVREIGVRKVLGATTGSIGRLLLGDFLRPVVLAILIACPLAWWAMHRWLQDFAYRTTISWWLFPVAGVGLMLIALSTVLVRSLQAGRANPIDNLRTE